MNADVNLFLLLFCCCCFFFQQETVDEEFIQMIKLSFKYWFYTDQTLIHICSKFSDTIIPYHTHSSRLEGVKGISASIFLKISIEIEVKGV